jgi:hypothetical protein
MTKWARRVSPWSVAALAAWIVILIVVANWAVPVFANVEGPGLQCSASVCPTVTTVEWVPILLTGGVAASLVVGTMWALRNRLRGPGHSR